MERTSRNTYGLVVLALSVGMTASACGGTSGTATEATTTAASSTTAAVSTPSQATTSAAGTASGTSLQSLLPTPANNQQTKGPDSIADNGIHLYYQVDGAPTAVLDAYKAALEAKGWAVTTITTSGNDGGGGGATYTGTNGDAYGVFDGGGYQSTTYLDVCAWPVKPANPNCSRSKR